MSLDKDKKQNNDDFDSMLLPFLGKKTDEADTASSSDKKDSPSAEEKLSPLEAVRRTVIKTAQVVNDKDSEKESASAETNTEPKKETKTVRTSTLLAKCMPYIYDDGINYAEEKPNYTLESVEDIIQSAEKRADEKIARMYRIKAEDIQRIGDDGAKKQKAETKTSAEKQQAEKSGKKPKLRLEETSIRKPLRIGETSRTSAKVFDTVSIPKVSDTLFDDFSARRTDVSGDKNVTTPYSTEGGMDSANDSRTRVIPELKTKNEDTTEFEDIMSHTKAIKTEDIPSSSKKAPVKVTSFSEEEPDIEVNDFKGEQDITRVGSQLKTACFAARIRLFVALIATAVAAIMHLPAVISVLEPVTRSIVSGIAFSVGFLANYSIFAGFKGAFSSKTKSELPLALSGSAMTVYFIYSIITAGYDFTPALIPLISLLFYCYCNYKKAKAVFGNFRLVAMRRTKNAITLIDDAATTSAMARSVISGEILAAGEKETDEIADFLRHTLSDRPFAGKLNVLSVVNCCAAFVTALSVGVGHASLSDALLSAAVMLSLGAMPSLYIADMLPFSSLSAKLRRVRAAVCSKYSAERIEQINAAVVSSADMFPSGCITLYNMNPLSSNNLDDTILLAAAVAAEAKSPLFPVLSDILTDETELPVADSIKYEDNLGLSGWVGDTHVMIGNRSLMQSHGVRIPDLDVDRKILHRGYFPVYIACEQRACALLVIGYRPDRTIENELGRLCDRGVTLLVSNCDPNITEEMLCDYYSLYPDLVKILDHNGKDKYERRIEPVDSSSAHAFHKGDIVSYLRILNGSFKLRGLSALLYVIHIVLAVVAWLIFTGIALGGSMALMSIGFCALMELICIIISLTAYFAGK